MAGIVKSTKRRFIIDKKIKEVEIPTGVLDTDLLFSDLATMSGETSNPTFTLEMNRLPAIVKNEAVLVITSGSIAAGYIRAMHGDTKTVEQLIFERNSSAISQYSTGQLYLRTANWPRVVYEGGFKGWLFEPASTNMVLYSGLGNYGAFEAFHSSHRTGLTVVQESGKTCVKVSSGRSNLAMAMINVEAGKVYTYSFWIKCATNFQLRFANYDGSSTYNNHYEDITSTWKRVVKTFIVRAGATVDYSHFYNNAGGNLPEFFVADIQLEEMPFATSYIPTADAVATRLSDKLTGGRPLSVFSSNSWYMESDQFTGWFGDYDMVGRNLLSYSNNTNQIFGGYLGATLTKTDNVVVTEWEATDATRIVSSGGTNAVRVIQNAGTPAAGEKVTLSGWFKNNGAKDILVYSNQGARSYRLKPNESLRIVFAAIEGNGVGSVQWQVNPVDIADNVDFTWWRLKYEKGDQATLWTPNPSDFVKISANGAVEVSSITPFCLRSLSLVPRKLNQGEY